MSHKPYDIAVLGGTLSARIAATLLARTGRKVLFLRQREATAPTWFYSSLFLEKLLGLLGGRSCFTAPLPFQVISRRARITLHPDLALDQELHRELGPAAAPALHLLNDLNRLGSQLEELLWAHGGLPWPSLRDRGRFRLQCLRRKIRVQDSEQPLTRLLEPLAEPARQLLSDLLQGLALVPLEQLTQADAALLWTQAMRPEQLKEPDFSQMLSKRFEQFHGATADLEQLTNLHRDGRRFTGGMFKEGGRFTATTFLLGDLRWRERFAPLDLSGLTSGPATFLHNLGDLTGQVSPLLKSRVVCGGPLPLRLTLTTHEGRHLGEIQGCGPANPRQVQTQLEPVLPFARYPLPASDAPPADQADSPPPPHLGQLPLKLAGNLYCADSTALLPALGAAGAALLAWTLNAQLGAAGR